MAPIQTTGLGPGQLYVPDTDPTRKHLHHSDYRLVTTGGRAFNSEICRNAGPWVKIWVDWYALQQDFVAQKGHQPQDIWESWDWLNRRDGPNLSASPRIQRLDRMIKAINDDGLVVILTVDRYFPLWASSYQGTDPENRDMRSRVPDDVSGSGPWAMFISHLLCRYKAGVPVNPTGPHLPGSTETSNAYYGNPSGARINLLEIVNEPNQEMWPQAVSNSQYMFCKVADMMKTAESLAYFWGWAATLQGLLAPATADRYTPSAPQPPDPNRYTDFDTFTRNVLDLLENWKPRVAFGWSHHNYYDIRQWQNLKNAEGVTFDSRVAIVHDRLVRSSWKGTTVDGKVWLTEGGYDKHLINQPTNAEITAADQDQDALCRMNYANMVGAAVHPDLDALLDDRHPALDQVGHAGRDERRGRRDARPQVPDRGQLAAAHAPARHRSHLPPTLIMDLNLGKFTFPGRAGELQRAGRMAALIAEVGDRYADYNRHLASELEASGGRPEPADYEGDFPGYAAACDAVRDLVAAEVFLRRARAHRGAGSFHGPLDGTPLVDGSHRIVSVETGRPAVDVPGSARARRQVSPEIRAPGLDG
ncbi:MAG TPA: hypothetical protein VF520_16180 [Thermoleophilaceae bacterium]